jgi:hypothetical protein
MLQHTVIEKKFDNDNWSWMHMKNRKKYQVTLSPVIISTNTLVYSHFFSSYSRFHEYISAF